MEQDLKRDGSSETTGQMDITVGEMGEIEKNVIQSSAYDQIRQRIFNDHEKLKLQLESQISEQELRKIELEIREPSDESERKKLAEDIEEIAAKNRSLQMASLELQKANENLMKLVEDQKIERENLNAEVIQFKKQLYMKQKLKMLELNIQRVRASLSILEHTELTEDYEDAEDLMNKFDALYNEFHEARKQLMNLLNMTYDDEKLNGLKNDWDEGPH